MSCLYHSRTHTHCVEDAGKSPGFFIKHRIELVLFFIACLCFFAALFPFPFFIKTLLFAGCILLAGYDMLWSGLKHIVRLQFEEEVLMTIAALAAFALREQMEACMVVLLFKIGEFLEEFAINKSKKNFQSLNEIRPESAKILNENATITEVAANSVQIGTLIILSPGDKVPLDCRVVEGRSSLDTSALTGESAPYYVEPGSELLSGSVNGEGVLKCITTKAFSDSAASQIIELVYSSSQTKGETEKIITRFSKIYTPIVLILGVFLAVLPPIFGLLSFQTSIMRALIFLVAACPCALVISVPLAFFSAVGAISKKGVLLKGSKYIETLSKLDCIAFDKTGTLTTGKLKVEQFIINAPFKKSDVFSYAATVEQFSSHPTAHAIRQYTNESSTIPVEDIKEYPGLGVVAKHNHKIILCGNDKLLDKYKIKHSTKAAAYLVIDGEIAATIHFSEVVPSEQKSTIQRLHRMGIKKVVMLTGDHEEAARKAAQMCAVDEWYASLLPSDKVSIVEKLKNQFKTVGFVGDGINDTPVLTSAHLGISMGLGSESANSSSDVILTDNQLSKLPMAIQLAKRSMRIIRFNIVFALTVKFLIMILCAFGLAPMWLGVLADTGVTIFAVLNAIRIFSFKVKNN